jgi:acyl-CoA thioester hydrolase
MSDRIKPSASLREIDSRYRVWVDVEPRFRDMDAMGHVNNAVYVTYLEVARQEYWARFRTAADYSKVPFVVARVQIDFRSSVQVGEVVRVYLRPRYVSTSSFAMEYALHDLGTGRLVAIAETVLVTYDWDHQRSMPVPDWLRSGLESVEGAPLPGKPPADV